MDTKNAVSEQIRRVIAALLEDDDSGVETPGSAPASAVPRVVKVEPGGLGLEDIYQELGHDDPAVVELKKFLSSFAGSDVRVVRRTPDTDRRFVSADQWQASYLNRYWRKYGHPGEGDGGNPYVFNLPDFQADVIAGGLPPVPAAPTASTLAGVVHTVNPETGIWPMGEWGGECRRGFRADPKSGKRKPPESDALKQERKARREQEELVQKQWARWARLRLVAPEIADKYRAEHQDESDDLNWLLAFSTIRSVGGVRIPGKPCFRAAAPDQP